jgi:hypothetical protein
MLRTALCNADTRLCLKLCFAKDRSHFARSELTLARAGRSHSRKTSHDKPPRITMRRPGRSCSPNSWRRGHHALQKPAPADRPLKRAPVPCLFSRSAPQCTTTHRPRSSPAGRSHSTADGAAAARALTPRRRRRRVPLAEGARAARAAVHRRAGAARRWRAARRQGRGNPGGEKRAASQSKHAMRPTGRGGREATRVARSGAQRQAGICIA